MVVCAVNPQWAAGNTGAFSYKYDAAGRQVAAGHGPDGGQCNPADATKPTTYDAENHIKSTENSWLVSDTPGDSGGSVQWGPDGRHRVDNTTSGGDTSAATAHWDGDTLLFQAPGPFLYVGKLAIMDSSGDILISDRDQTGTQMTSHAYTISRPPSWAPNGLWFTGMTLGNVRSVYIYKNEERINIQASNGTCGYTSGS